MAATAAAKAMRFSIGATSSVVLEGVGGLAVGSASARLRASSNFFSRISLDRFVCCTERANFSSRTLFCECTRLTRSSKSLGGAFFLSAQTTAPVSGSTLSSASQQGQVTSSASGMRRSYRGAGPGASPRRAPPSRGKIAARPRDILRAREGES